MRSMTEGLLQSKGTTPQALTRQLPLHRGAESSPNTKRERTFAFVPFFMFLYFTRWRLIFIEVVFSNAVVRSSTFRTCL